MTEKEKHQYLEFDRYLQVAGTKYEKDLLEIEKKYYNDEINEKQFEEQWNIIVDKVLNKK